jgi:hypothetical protein
MKGAKNKKTTRLSGFLPTEVVRTENNPLSAKVTQLFNNQILK